MYAVTYECDCLPLCPEIRGADIQFSGDLDLNGYPSGEWTIANIWVRTEIMPPVGYRPLVAKERMTRSHPLYVLIEKAARAYDKRTGLITIQVSDELRGADKAAAADRRRMMAAE